MKTRIYIWHLTRDRRSCDLQIRGAQIERAVADMLVQQKFDKVGALNEARRMLNDPGVFARRLTS